MENIEHPPPGGERRWLKKRVIIVLISLLALAVIAWWLLPSELLGGLGGVPGYGGKTAEQWLPEVIGPNPQPALQAFQAMGPKALPFLVREMGRRDGAWEKWYARAYLKFPGWLRKRLSPPSGIPPAVAWNAAEIVLTRNPGARKTLPALARLLNDRGIYSHTYIALAIARLAREGDKDYVRNLAKGLRDRDPQVRQFVAGALEKIGPSAKAAIPALKAALNDPWPDARMEIAWALWGIDQETNVCREAIIGALKSGMSHPLDQMAIFHLMEMDPKDAAVVSLLMSRMEAEPESLQRWDCGVLQDIGPPAKAAVPLLIKLAQKGSPNLRKEALRALKSIDPEAAAKYEHP